jgi:NAD(P)H-dependent flavin oxidoreductase YrpB (nitropropane dioxygenase family)
MRNITVAIDEETYLAARVARNAISEQVAEIQKDPTKSFADVKELMAGVRGRNNVLRDGDLNGGIWTTGQSEALIHDVPTCAEVVRNIMAQADGILAKRFVAIAD